MNKTSNKYIAKKLLTNPKWIGVDFDNTIAKAVWPQEGCGEAIPGAIESLKHLQSRGWKIIIFSARHWFDHIALEKWFADHDFIPDQIFLGKPFMLLLIDDSAYRFRSWDEDLPKIEAILNREEANGK